MDMTIKRDADGVEDKTRRRGKKVELVQEAIHGILEDKKRRSQRKQGSGGRDSVAREDQDQEEEGIISSLLCKLDALDNAADMNGLNNEEPNSVHPNSEVKQGEISKEVELSDIAKDLSKIKRQNMITHILLGTVIVMTAVWQFNEVSLLLAVQRKLRNPFKSIGELIKGSLMGRGKNPTIEAPPLPPVGVPDVTHNDLPMLVIGSGGV